MRDLHLSNLLKAFTFFVILLMVSACNLPASLKPAEEKSDTAPTQTSQAIQILLMTQMAGTLAPPTATVPPPPTPTPPTLETATPTASPTPTIPTPRSDLCTDKAEFVKDVSVPDNSLFQPGATFTKTWRLRNVGTCAWTPQYALVLAGGDAMGAPNEVPLTTYVDPGNVIDLSVSLTAPSQNGQYQAEWMIRSADGSRFGIGKNADKPFWVRISVSQTATDLNLGAPTWSDTFKNSANWYLLETAYTRFSVKNGNLVMETSPGGGDEWGLSNQKALTDFYMDVAFKTGNACSGKDRYGLLFRAPNPNAGYVFGFTCDGRFRLYKWDGANYSPLQEWKNSDAIHAGPDQSNRLSVWAKGNTLKLYANGVLLGEYIDATYTKGRFGLFIGAAESDPFKVFVEEIAYWLLE